MSAAVKWWAALVLLFVLALALALAPSGAVRGPRLVVLISVDQLRGDFITRFEPLYSGGLRWLLDHGAYFPDSAYRHSSTVTAAGHATISTGKHPATHGVVGNSWREEGRGSVYCVEDAGHAVVGGTGEGRSPRNLLADALGDRLKQRNPGAVVYSLSTKDRAAVLMGGRRADGAFWYSADCGCLVSSTYYGDELPGWLREFNASGPASAYAGRDWERLLDDEALYEEMARADSFPGEGEADSFPHGRGETEFESTLTATPFSDEITLAAALAAIRSGELGSDAVPDLLAIGLSATDSIGHRYGPFSQEAMDNHLRLDRGLGELLTVLDEEVGLDRVLIGLSADHGVQTLVEQLVADGVEARRLSTSEFWSAVRRSVEFCGSGPLDAVVDSASGRNLYWNEAGLRERGVSRAQASRCLAERLRRRRHVAEVWTAEILAAGGGQGDAALHENSYFESRSPHVQVQFDRYVYAGGETGTGHGTANDFDRSVPVMLAGFGIQQGRYPGEAGPEDLAPTVGSVLGLDLDLEPDTRVLGEALARPAE